MSSRRGGRNSKGKEVCEFNSLPKVNQLSHGVADVSLDSVQDDGEWEIIARKSKNRAGSSAAKQIQFGRQSSNHKSWTPAQQDAQKLSMRSGTGPSLNANSHKPAARRNARHQSNSNGGYGNNLVAPNNMIPAQLDNGWNWKSRAGKTDNNVAAAAPADDNDDDNSDPLSDIEDDDDDLFGDEFDSYSSEKCHETRKKRFKKFFEAFDVLSLDEIYDPNRHWHCPACKSGHDCRDDSGNGPGHGAVFWYAGLLAMKQHAETIGSNKVKLHRELAKLLDEELQMRGVLATPVEQTYGRWVGLGDEEKDSIIVWPPMVVIMNTQLERDENGRMIGMGNEELRNYFRPYCPHKARHSYGPQGHRGMGILVFEPSPRGYLEAERLHRHLAEEGLGRAAWDGRPTLFSAGGLRQLYGYMALKRDLDEFNQHCDEKSKMKFEMKHYLETVLYPMRHRYVEGEQVLAWKDELPNEQKLRKEAEEYVTILRDKLEKAMEENKILKHRITMQLRENKEEMDLQEEFYKDVLSRARD